LIFSLNKLSKIEANYRHASLSCTLESLYLLIDFGSSDFSTLTFTGAEDANTSGGPFFVEVVQAYVFY
jgi:hypothetical protein